MIVGHVYTVKSYFIIQYQYENQLFQLLGSEILFNEVPKVSSLCYFALCGYFKLIFVSFHNILTVPLPCLFGQAKLCQAGLVLGQVRPFGMLIYFDDFKLIFQKVLESRHRHRPKCVQCFDINSTKKNQCHWVSINCILDLKKESKFCCAITPCSIYMLTTSSLLVYLRKQCY